MRRLQIQSSDTRIGHRTESNYVLFNNLDKISFNQSCNMHFIKFQINISDAFFLFSYLNYFSQCILASLVSLSNICDNFSSTSALSQWSMHLYLLQLLLLVISWYVMPEPIKYQLYTLIDNVLFPYATLMTSSASEVTKYRVTYSLFRTINVLSSV